MILLNLLSMYLSVVNSRINGLYWASTTDVHLDVQAMGCDFSLVLLPGRVSVNFCAKIPLNPSKHLSVMTINGVPSN